MSYIAIAWYDYLYNCSAKLFSGSYPGINTLDTWAKPQRINDTKDLPQLGKLKPDQESSYRRNVNLFHVLVLGPLLIYVGWFGKKSNKYIFPLIFGIGVMAFIYHSFRIFSPREVFNCKNTNYDTVKLELGIMKTIYIFHALIIAPILIYVGWFGINSFSAIFPIILFFGIIGFFYHLFRVFYPRKPSKC